MGRTINGKSLDEVMKALAEPFKSEDFKENKYNFFYLPEEKFRQRLDSVVGIKNYDFVTSEPKVYTIGTRQHIGLSGSITLYDDDGKKIVTKSACGGTTIIISNTSNEAVSFKNDLDTAAKDVFKRCCKLFGMAEAQLKEFRKGEKLPEGQEEALTLFRVTLKESFTALGTKGYAALVSVEGESEPCKLIIWKDKYDQIEKYISMEKFIKVYKAGKTFSIYGQKSVFKKKSGDKELQIIFEKPKGDSDE